MYLPFSTLLGCAVLSVDELLDYKKWCCSVTAINEFHFTIIFLQVVLVICFPDELNAQQKEVQQQCDI